MKFSTVLIASMVVFAVIAGVLFFAGSTQSVVTTTAVPFNGVRKVAVTTYPIWLFTREVMEGTGQEPILMTAPDAGCPHDYVLTANDLMKIGKDWLLLFKNGAGMDDHLCKTAATANKLIQEVDTGAGIAIIDHDAEEGDHDHEAETAESGHVHDGENGHFFASPYEARTIVANITAALALNDPEHAAAYRANAASLDKRLQILGDEFKTALAPFTSNQVAAQHSVFDYLLRDSGFGIPLVIFADPATPPSPAEITKLSKEFKDKNVRVIFTEPQYPENLAQLISKETGAKVVKLDPAATGPANPPSGYYFDVMRRNLTAMKEAFAQ